MGQNQEIGHRLKQYLRQRLGDTGAHLGKGCGIERLSESSLSCLIVRPLRIAVPDAVVTAMEARTERACATSEQPCDA